MIFTKFSAANDIPINVHHGSDLCYPIKGHCHGNQFWGEIDLPHHYLAHWHLDWRSCNSNITRLNADYPATFSEKKIGKLYSVKPVIMTLEIETFLMIQ